MGSSPLTSTTSGIVKWYNSVKRLICIRLRSAFNFACHAKVRGSIPLAAANIGEYFNWLEGHLDGW